MERKREDEAIVLDFLQHGYPFDKRPSHVKTPIAQALGITNFSLLELVPRKDVTLRLFERVYIGDDKREKIHHVNGKISHRKLTTTAKSELSHTVKLLVEEQEARFIAFYNTAMPLNLRVHTLELLPGVGKKHTREIIDVREEEPFKNFDDLRARVKSISDPVKLLVNRIIAEVEGEEKFNLFVR